MPKTQSASHKQAMKAWVDENPLRQWRHQNEVSIMEAAVEIGVSMTTIQLWEKGVYLPLAEHAKTLDRVIGRGTRVRWAEWKNRQPAAASMAS